MSEDPWDYVGSWKIHLAAERKSPSTIKSYTDGVRLYRAYCEREGIAPALDRGSVRAFVAALLEGGAEAATARARLFGVKRFSAWLESEDLIEVDMLPGIKPPKLDDKAVPGLTPEQCSALIAACAGKELWDLRDAAMFRLLLETTMRIGECLALDVEDVDFTTMLATVRRGKGGKARVVPFGPRAAQAIDRYLRARRKHPKAQSCPALWLADRRERLGYGGALKALGDRAEAAGVEDFHPHLTRHTSAQNWLDAGGSEGGLMAVAGWTSHAMLRRYTKATAARRAAEEARGLGLGDF